MLELICWTLSSVLQEDAACCTDTLHFSFYHRQSLLPLHLSPKDRFLPHQYQKVFHFPCQYPASLTACQKGNDVHTQIQKTQCYQGSESWKTEVALLECKMNKSTLSVFLQQKNSTSNLFQLQSQIKFNELTNSQQLSPQIQTLMLKISKSTIASMQKVPSSLLWQMPFRGKWFGLQRDLLTKLRRPKHLENSANNCKMSTDYFSV